MDMILLTHGDILRLACERSEELFKEKSYFECTPQEVLAKDKAWRAWYDIRRILAVIPVEVSNSNYIDSIINMKEGNKK
jgi:hypothetical protein